MLIHVYDKAAGRLLYTEQVERYDADKLYLENGVIEYDQFSGDVEFSILPDLSQTLRADWRAKQPENIVRSAAALTFVAMAESDLMPEVFNATAIAEHSALFEAYVPGKAYTAGQIRTDPADGALYKCITSHGAEHAADQPLSASNLWQRVADPGEQFPAWFPATGTFDQWPPGAKCSHNGKNWINELTVNNVWEPGVYGWSEAAA